MHGPIFSLSLYLSFAIGSHTTAVLCKTECYGRKGVKGKRDTAKMYTYTEQIKILIIIKHHLGMMSQKGHLGVFVSVFHLLF